MLDAFLQTKKSPFLSLNTSEQVAVEVCVLAWHLIQHPRWRGRRREGHVMS